MGPASGQTARFRDRVSALPDAPGVYLFKGAGGDVLYVGKAGSLRKRVATYFQDPERLAPRIRKLVGLIEDIEVRPAASDAEALLREAELIKTFHPKYNVVFRDDKSYPCLKLTKEPFPRLLPGRKRKAPFEDTSARYFGPYPDAGLMRQALQYLRRVFPLRTCTTFPDAPCLEYHLGQCLAPCVGFIDHTRYDQIADDLIAFLEGRHDALLRELSRRMERAARDQRYEDAARLRDQLQALTSVIVAKEKSLHAGPLEQLQLALKLPALPRRIEAFDISNIMGTYAVGSMVCFTDGAPHRAHYRRFKIETVQGSDDVRMMAEVVRRRYGGQLAQALPEPDLILVDGGKGQLGAAREALAALGRGAAPIMGLAKQHEEIFLPDRREPIVLLPTSPVLHLIQRIRDEAHRFAITYHRRLRGTQVAASALDGIRGIGPKKKAALLARFGSVKRLRAAGAADVARAARISVVSAQQLLQFIRGHNTISGNSIVSPE